ncbi:hypothetical protein DW322_01760 [Rhodococcus rhodnii]|uniref:Transcriptional regulator, AbiEi antitoxin, Type IV TA system n=1 Tax=Rhodococcus rhodnii TaxID=38312 RepID=A0A6P2CKB1_9NOCA|nr:hypothetical protein [Rhodococcus rhodnii]TXG92300.1 hypothetical protein DW322_01760 [Rhodococcus rhodnii]
MPSPFLRRSQALAAGFTDHELRTALGRGELVALRRGVFVPREVHDATDEIEHHRLAALAASDESEGVFSHVTAAVLHGLAVWDLPLKRLHVTVGGGSHGKATARRVVHAAPLDESDVVTITGVRVTSVARTVVDLAHTVGFEQAVVTGDAALARISAHELSDATERRTGRRGAPAARRALAFLDGRSESVGESRSRVLLHRAGFPPPELQHRIHTVQGEFIGRVDFAWEEFGVVGEFDGFAKYGEGRDAFEALRREKHREDALRAAGWVVARWTWEHLDRPDAVAQRIRYAVAAASGRRTLPDSPSR